MSDTTTVIWYCPECGYQNFDVLEKGISLECSSCEESFHPDSILKREDTVTEVTDDTE
jgi:predicted RNA-binding Zn-ribbon protein involved in translation (DUF1610 family)